MPARRHRETLIVERSRFLCTVERVETPEQAQAFVRSINAEFPDATHHCWAYVAGPPGSTSRIGMSDDGEPHGTAGRPMLAVLLHADLGDVGVVVTRWYGGTKLGTGGLARAYSGAVQQALATLPTAVRIDAVALQVIVDYAAITVVQQLLQALDAVVTRESYAEVVTFDIEVERGRAESLRTQLADLTRGQGQVLPETTPSA